MKRWTLPARYKTLEKLFVFPLMFTKREASLRIMENSPHIQGMIDLLNLLPQTTADLPLGITWDEKEQEKKLRTSYILGFKGCLHAAIGYIVMEELGYDMGKYPPSAYFKDHPMPVVASQKDAEDLAVSLYDIQSSKFRAAVFDWGIYIRCNDLDDMLNSFWYYEEKQKWCHDHNRKLDMQLLWS